MCVSPYWVRGNNKSIIHSLLGTHVHCLHGTYCKRVNERLMRERENMCCIYIFVWIRDGVADGALCHREDAPSLRYSL